MKATQVLGEGRRDVTCQQRCKGRSTKISPILRRWRSSASRDTHTFCRTSDGRAAGREPSARIHRPRTDLDATIQDGGRHSDILCTCRVGRTTVGMFVLWRAWPHTTTELAVVQPVLIPGTHRTTVCKIYAWGSPCIFGCVSQWRGRFQMSAHSWRRQSQHACSQGVCSGRRHAVWLRAQLRLCSCACLCMGAKQVSDKHIFAPNACWLAGTKTTHCATHVGLAGSKKWKCCRCRDLSEVESFQPRAPGVNTPQSGGGLGVPHLPGRKECVDGGKRRRL